MAERPLVSPATEAMYELAEAHADKDGPTGWQLLEFMQAVCAAYLDRIYDLVTDSATHVGWGKVFDPDETPDFALNYLAQFVGSRLRPEQSIDERRAVIKRPDSWRRGHPDMIEAAIKRRLTGTKTVQLVERADGNAWRLEYKTLPAETPNPEGTERDFLTQKPAGIVYDAEEGGGQTYRQLRDNHSDYLDVTTSYGDYAQVRNGP